MSIALLIMSAAIAVAGQNEPQKARVETRIEVKRIDPTVRYEFSRTVGAGRVVLAREGKPGMIRRTYRLTYEGKKPRRELIQEERTEPTHRLYYMGRSGYQPSRGAFTRSRVVTMKASAYDPGPLSCGPNATGRTKTGMKATHGVVAVDPRVIPLGTLVFVEGYGFAIAADIGSAIKGNRIDLCYPSRSRALAFGRQLVRVHIMKSPVKITR